MDAAVEASSHRRALNDGVRWTGTAHVLSAILQFGVLIVLARMLTPAEFGLVAMAMAVIAVVSVLQTLGTHGPLIQRDRISAALVDTVFALNFVLSLLLMAGLMALAPWVAMLYRAPAVEPVIQVIALVLLCYALSGVPGALLRRRMHFGALAVAHMAGALLSAVVAITLATLGYGVWALVAAMLVSAITEAVFIMIAARFRPHFGFSWSELRSIAGFAANMTGINLIHLVLRNADSLIIGRWLGAGAVGLFGMATRFTRQPVEMFVGAVLGPVLFPAYSQQKHDDALTAKTMQRALAGATFLMFPLLGGVAAVARPFVDGVLGAAWADAYVLILLMAPVGMLRTMLSTTGSIFLARDRTRLLFGIRGAGGLLLLCAYLGGVQVGLVAVVAAVLVAELLAAILELALAARLVRISPFTLVAGARGPLLATVAMVAVVVGLDLLLVARGWGDIAILLLAVPVGVGIYTGLALACRMRAIGDLVDLLPERIASRVRARVPAPA